MANAPAKLSDEAFQQSLRLACSFFPVEDLYNKLHEEQILTLRKIFKGNDIFFSAPTGFGKSIIYELIPVIADDMRGLVPGSNFIIVISPLKALMKDQVKYLNTETAVNAVDLTDSVDNKETLNYISEGSYCIIYSSPETFLSKTTWRELALSYDFRVRCVAIVIDEAHCIVQW